MKIKLSNERIITEASRLAEISKKNLPIKVSYAIAKNISKIESELKTYNNERVKLIEKYAARDEKGQIKSDSNGQIIFKEDCQETWNQDIKALLSIENEIDIHKFNISELDGYSITPAELMLIDYMIEE